MKFIKYINKKFMIFLNFKSCNISYYKFIIKIIFFSYSISYF